MVMFVVNAVPFTPAFLISPTLNVCSTVLFFLLWGLVECPRPMVKYFSILYLKREIIFSKLFFSNFFFHIVL